MCHVVAGSLRHTATWMYWSGVLNGGWKRLVGAAVGSLPGCGAEAAEEASALSADDCASPNSGSPAWSCRKQFFSLLVAHCLNWTVVAFLVSPVTTSTVFHEAGRPTSADDPVAAQMTPIKPIQPDKPAAASEKPTRTPVCGA